MSRVYKRKDGLGVLRIRPEGAINDIIFDGGFHRCGQAEGGVGFTVDNWKGVSVLTNDDLMAIVSFAKEHFKQLEQECEVTNGQ